MVYMQAILFIESSISSHLSYIPLGIVYSFLKKLKLIHACHNLK